MFSLPWLGRYCTHQQLQSNWCVQEQKVGQGVLFTTEFDWHVILMDHPHQPYLQTMSAATSQTLIETQIALHPMVLMRFEIYLTSGIRLMPFIGIQA